MNYVLSLFKRFERHQDRIEQQLTESYLARATDVYDLESKIRELDRRGNQFNWLP